jgi:NADP-dependent 3-hydroxy acid dehydrogenase YdfG
VSGAPPLAGQVALVSGASRGIGLAVADGLRVAGAHVVRLARSLADASGEGETTIRCDVTRPDDVERAVRRTLEAVGAPHIVVNSAGTFLIKPIPETTTAEFTASLAVNVAGPFLLVRSLLPRLVERGSGHFVTVGSIADHVAYPGNAAYSAGKFGVRGFHEVLRAEVAGTGVRTTLVSPGPVNTDVWDTIQPDTRPGFTKRRDMMLPADVAEAVLFAVTRPERVDVTEIRLVPGGRR